MSETDSWGEGPSAVAAITALKTSIANELIADDPTLRIKTTEYFNNTFAPDMVLRWEEQEERQLFLRTNVDWAALMEDVAWVAERRPILMPLQETERPHARDDLQEVAARSSTLVTPRSSMAALVDEGAPTQLSRLLISSVLRGGRGVMDSNRAERTVASIDAAYTAAQAAESDPVVQAVDELEELVDVRNSGVLTRFLQAVWIGSGGSASTFPGATGATGALDAAGLQLLLDIADADDDEFWERIARGMRLEQLVAIQAGPESATLQALMKHLLPTLRAAGCGLADFQLADGADGRTWFVQRGYLALQLPRFRAVFTPSSISRYDIGQRMSGSAPIFRVLKDRAEDVDVRFTEIKLETASGNEVTIRPGVAADLDDESLLDELATLAQAPTVESVTIQLSSERNLVCDLADFEARARTRGSFYVTELLEHGLPLLFDLNPAEKRLIGAMLATEESDGEAETAGGPPRG